MSNESSPEFDQSNIRYSTKSELIAHKDNDKIVDYNLARQIAYTDLSINNSFEKNGWQNCRLSEEPIIIYDFNGEPLFYDFII